MEPVTTPPGWYHDGTATRWWDGFAWGPYAPLAPIDPVAAGKTTAVISHFGLFACWFVVPLVILLTSGKDNEYVRHHSTEALNFMITTGIVFVLAWTAYFTLLVTSLGTDGDGFPAFFLVMPLIWALQLFVLIFAVIGGVRASQGVWWRYPISIRFVRGARPAR